MALLKYIAETANGKRRDVWTSRGKAQSTAHGWAMHGQHSHVSDRRGEIVYCSREVSGTPCLTKTRPSVSKEKLADIEASMRDAAKALLGMISLNEWGTAAKYAKQLETYRASYYSQSQGRDIYLETGNLKLGNTRVQ